MTDEEIKDLYERQIGQAVVDCLQSQNRLRAHVRLVETVLGFAHNIVSEAYEEAAQVVEGERLTANTGDEGDIAYNTALEHAIEAIRALKTRLAGEVKA